METTLISNNQGSIKSMIDQIIRQRGRGNAMLEGVTRTKLLLKGINPALFLDTTPDDPKVISKVALIGKEFGVQFSGINNLTTPPNQNLSRFN